MTRLLAVITAAVAVLALPAGATAKELRKARVCGASGCETVTSEKDRQGIVAAFENGGPPSTPPARHAAFYRVAIYIRGDRPPAGEPSLRLLIVPTARRVRGGDGTWFEMDSIAYRAWHRVTRDIKPFPASKLPGVDPSAPQPTTGGQLPPQTYAPALQAPAATDDGPDWALIGASIAASALIAGLAIGLHRRRRREGPQTAPVS
jgi:hypothetical protein